MKKRFLLSAFCCSALLLSAFYDTCAQSFGKTERKKPQAPYLADYSPHQSIKRTKFKTSEPQTEPENIGESPAENMSEASKTTNNLQNEIKEKEKEKEKEKNQEEKSNKDKENKNDVKNNDPDKYNDIYANYLDDLVKFSKDGRIPKDSQVYKDLELMTTDELIEFHRHANDQFKQNKISPREKVRKALEEKAQND